jgi:hypothetical protein
VGDDSAAGQAVRRSALTVIVLAQLGCRDYSRLSRNLDGGAGDGAAHTRLYTLDFETPLTPEWSPTITSGSTIQVDTTRAHRGSSSLDALLAANSVMPQMALVSRTDPTLPSELYFRLWLFRANLADGDVVTYQQWAAPYRTLSLSLVSGQLYFRSEAATPGELPIAAPFRAGVWTCVIVHLTLQGNMLGVSVSIDGGAPQSAMLGLSTEAQWGVINLGHYNPTPVATQLWTDDLIVDSQPVICAE